MTASLRNLGSKSIIVPFASRWSESINDKNIKVFFRKRGPARMPKNIVIYLGVPISSIVAVAEVEKLERIDLNVALSLADIGCISEGELKSYIGYDKIVTAIFIKNQKNFKNPLGVKAIRKTMNFHPPQNFIQINDATLHALEDLGNA